ncbi:MAG: Gfo/Idh/MocA family oxidoreductase [Planctomycetia bacterium]|nr:Gfo/Idh/MocA family oxidoreductase [Planctomycetia bacterium]
MAKIATRRQFLKKSSIALKGATVAVLGSGIGTPYSFSSEQPKRQKGINERLRIGAIGTSEYRAGIWDSSTSFDGRGAQIARKAAEFGEMVAVADVFLPFAKRFAEYFPDKCVPYQDYEKILEDPTIDVVTIGTPDHWHTKIAIEAMKAGKHVYVEKPLTLTIQESQLIAQVAKETGRIVQVGSQQRTENPTFMKAAALCRSGRLGKNISAVCSCPNNESIAYQGVMDKRVPFKPQPIPDGLNWDKWLGQTPWEDYFLERCFYNFRWWSAYSGGEITNWGGHNVDFAVWAMNLTNTAPVEISGTGEFPNIQGWYDTAEVFDVTFKYREGNSLRLKSGENAVLLTGELGRIRVNRGRLTGKPVEILTPQDEEELAEVMNDLMKGKKPGNHMKNFFDSIEDGTLPVSDVFSTVNGINMCHMANICLKTGQTLHWNQEQYKFDEPIATSMISRKPRQGYEIKM